jgi:hypothetical protein
MEEKLLYEKELILPKKKVLGYMYSMAAPWVILALFIIAAVGLALGIAISDNNGLGYFGDYLLMFCIIAVSIYILSMVVGLSKAKKDRQGKKIKDGQLKFNYKLYESYYVFENDNYLLSKIMTGQKEKYNYVRKIIEKKKYYTIIDSRKDKVNVFKYMLTDKEQEMFKEFIENKFDKKQYTID